VSIRRRPVLSINSDFLEQHVLTEMDLRTLFLHEFLHVLLNHTLRYKVNTPLLNLALDSIINSIIHRFFGTEYSDFFCRYYSTDGAMALLRPAQFVSIPTELRAVHGQVYRGEISADEVHELLEFLLGASLDLKGIEFLGGHDFNQPVSEKNKKILLLTSLMFSRKFNLRKVSQPLSRKWMMRRKTSIQSLKNIWVVYRDGSFGSPPLVSKKHSL
jgi:hypothetical protein